MKNIWIVLVIIAIFIFSIIQLIDFHFLYKIIIVCLSGFLFGFFKLKWLKNKAVYSVLNKKVLNRFNLLMDTIPFIVIITNNKGKIVDVNKKAIGSYGYSHAEFMTLHFSNIVYRKHESAHLKKNKDLLFVNTLIKKERNRFTYYVLSGDLKKEESINNHYKIKYYELFNDIQSQLLENKQNYLSLFDYSPVGIVSCNLNGEIEYLNNKIITLLGSPSKTTTMGFNIFTFPNLVKSGISNIFKQSIKEKKTINHEGYYQSKWGTAIYYKFLISPLKKDGEVCGAIAIVEDCTYKKLIETQLEKEKNLTIELIETVPDRIYVKSIDHKYIIINKAMTDYLGVKQPSDAIGTDDSSYFENYEEIHKLENKLLKDEVPINYKEVISVNGKSKWLNNIKLLLKNKEGDITGIVGITHDITDLKLTQKALEESKNQINERNKELEESNEILENFAYTTSHDLKTPLRGINSFLDKLLNRLKVLSYDLKDEKIEKYVMFIKKSAIQMNSIVTDTLNYARVSKNDLHLTNNSIVACIKESLPYNNKNCVKILIKPSLCVMSDKIQLISVFQNLINNSLKFNSKKLKRVEIGYNKNKNYVYIKDNGDGIDSEHYDKIFNLFQRLHGSKIDGNGLGLAIVKRIIQRHQWTIEVESQVGRGTIFKIYFN